MPGMPVWGMVLLCLFVAVVLAFLGRMVYLLGRLDQRLLGMAVMGKATHALVNYASGELMREKAVLLRQKADRDKLPEDIRAAAKAEREYAEHQHRQAIMDALPGTAEEKSGKSGVATKKGNDQTE
jgi:hypothetical protein